MSKTVNKFLVRQRNGIFHIIALAPPCRPSCSKNPSEINIFLFFFHYRRVFHYVLGRAFPSSHLTECLFTLAQRNNKISLDCHLLLLLFGKSLSSLSPDVFQRVFLSPLLLLLQSRNSETGQLMENVSKCFLFCLCYSILLWWLSVKLRNHLEGDAEHCRHV